MTLPEAIASIRRRLKTLPGPLFSFSSAFLILILFASPLGAGLKPADTKGECGQPCAIAENYEGYDAPNRNNPETEIPEELMQGEVMAPAPSTVVIENEPEEKTPEAPRQTAGPGEEILPHAPRIASPPDITRGPIDNMELSITFDGGGYEGEEAWAILDTLREKGIRTTIFITGMFIRNYPDVTKRIVADGHEVGNHTMTHPRLTSFATTLRQRTLPWVTRAFVEKELKSTAELFRAVTGSEMAPLWRAPYGEINEDIRRWAFESGFIHIGWTSDYSRRESLDTLDWVYDRSSSLYRTSSQIKERILRFGRSGNGARGGIILMHLGTERKSDRASGVLGEMIDELRGRGYRFVKVSGLIEGNPAYAFLQAQRGEKVLKGLVRLVGKDKLLAMD